MSMNEENIEEEEYKDDEEEEVGHFSELLEEQKSNRD